MIDSSKPLLLVDLGFALFYRYSATQTWYRHAHPEEKDDLTKDYKWPSNKVFMEKMKEMFSKDILALAKKLKIPHANIIIAEDCRLKNNWRTKIYSEYKAHRAEARGKTGWCGGPAFNCILSVTLPQMIKDTGVQHLSHKRAEADDIISQIIIGCRKDPDQPKQFYIIASDMDYFQLLNGDTKLINMKGQTQSHKMKFKPEEHLMEKILIGDKSDNIPACRFNKVWVHRLVPPKPKVNFTSDKKVFINCNKKILDYYKSNPNQLELDITQVKQNGDEYILDCTQNRTLIDFNYLPDDITNEIWDKYKKL